LFLHSNEIDKQNITLSDKGTQYYMEAEDFQKNGEFIQAIDAVNKSLAHVKTTLDKEKECAHLIKLGLLYWNLGQMSISTEKYEAALNVAKRNNLEKQILESQKALDIHSHYVEAKKYRDKEQFQEAAKIFQKAISIAQQISSREHELKCLRQLGFTYWLINDWEQFYLYNKKGLELARELNHKIETGRCSNNLGLYWRYKTDYSQALRYYQEALQIARELKNKIDEADVLNNMGVIYKDFGDFDKALDYLREALIIDQE
jgi:tetratricopeptide (TPR) repeat protein